MERDRGRYVPGGRESAHQADYLELFFDLVLVFALNGLVNRIVPALTTDDLNVRWAALFQTVVLALPLLWLWTTTGHITSRFDPRRRLIQLVVLISALGLLIMGTSLPYAFSGRGLAFALPYVLLQAGRPLLFIFTLPVGDAVRALYLRSAIWFAGSAVLWIGGALTTEWRRVVLWTSAVAVDLIGARLNWPVRGLARLPASAWAVERGRHLPERYQQLLLIALGETVLALGISYTNEPATTETTIGLLTAYLTTVLLWRVYYHRSGEMLGEALDSVRGRNNLGRITGAAHIVMVFGIVATAIGYKLVQQHALDRPFPLWVVVILGGPALFLWGRIRLERVVFDRLSRRRVVAIVALAVLMVPLAFTSALVAAIAASVVLFGVAAADARRSAGRPPEAPAPPA
ncbi:Low temperature requirement protein LtrA [Micromonospora nigra]|uniref:Low temperature requirement protein LtrA n=1 Tax=Micromonospora nigra TaxID=145857 RepID=A0A1C6RBZ3_9ACTN|nr:low temperature requirement protein A [Micromonospora nigra]SCL14502.1 Low temperature requirement protein LtrA [Micromonospora nigra]